MSVAYSQLTNNLCPKLFVAFLFLNTVAFYICIMKSKQPFYVVESQPENCVTNEEKDNIQISSGIIANKPSAKTHIVNTLPTEQDPELHHTLEKLISQQAEPHNPELVSLVREMMDPPSKHIIKVVQQIVETPQSKEAMQILKRKKNGFFIEVGALDGERSSNTLHLEQRKGWTGLLIEMDPYYYTQLLGKCRKSWSINACISPYNYPTEMAFKEASGGTGTLISGKGSKTSGKVPCFPLETMLLALNQTKVDYFSLDVEGYELEVLKTVPFDRLDITMLSVEYVHGRNGKEAYEAFMKGIGYKVHKDIHFHRPEIAMYVDDFIFVKEDFEL